MPFSQSLLLQLLPLLSLITTTTTLLHNVDAFTVALPVGGVLRPTRPSSTSVLIRYLSDKDTATSAFVPLNQEEEEEDDDVLDKVEMFGKGAAKVRIL